MRIGDELIGRLTETAAGTGFSGVIAIDRPGRDRYRRAFGQADRRFEVANTTATRFGTASATKGFTALTVMALVEEGMLTLDTTARSVLGSTLPLIDDAVTVEQLLAHRSGIGDYLDESVLADDTAYVMPVPVHQLAATEDYVTVLDGYPQSFPPGTRFAYNNSGFVVLALIAERVAGVPYGELVDGRVCRPAGLADTGFVRSDQLEPGAATGYLYNEGLQTNVLHLPVLGIGDGGIYTTVDDISRLWSAFFDDRIVSVASREAMTASHSTDDDGRRHYGLGFWLPGTGRVVALAGGDAGVSFRSVYDPESKSGFTIVSNTTGGAWPLVRVLEQAIE